MAVITRIKINNKEKGFYQVDISETSGRTIELNLHEDVLVHEALRKGLALSGDRLRRLLAESEGIRAYHAALRYLAFRMRSVREMRDYLKKKDYSAAQIAFAVGRLKKEKLLDDRSFAVSFIRTRIRTSTKGPQLIYRELLRAGVAGELAQQTEALFPEDVQLEHARKYLAKQTASVKNKKSALEARQVLARRLMQRGYSRTISDRVIAEIDGFLKENEKRALIAEGERSMQKFKKSSGAEFIRKVKSNLYRKGFPPEAIIAFVEERTSGRD